MVYDAFKKLVFLLTILIISFVSAYAQNNKKEFSKDYNKYLKELSGCMLASDNGDLKIIIKGLKRFPEDYCLNQQNSNCFYF